MDGGGGWRRCVLLFRRHRRTAAFPDSFTRLHALTKADNLGVGLVVLGLLPQVDSVSAGLKLVCIWLLVQLSGATAGQLIARTLRRGESRS